MTLLAAKEKKPKYATWIRQKKILTFWALSISLFVAGTLAGLLYGPLALTALLALPFFYIASIISLAAFRFGIRGGDFQNKIHETLMASLGSNQSVLDIGCGSGNLVIKIAKRNTPNHIGLDFWGEDWEYSKSQCENNARLEQVKNVSFVQGSASALPFDSGSIDNVVSCLTFHEVKDAADKIKSLEEAMRVLAPGGRFAFFDLFNDASYFRRLEDVKNSIEAAHGKIDTIKPYSQIESLPFPLNMPKVLQYAVLIAGEKSEI
jgi:ubiquinone/menaquinone biosynthesis C-methylase UbiE